MQGRKARHIFEKTFLIVLKSKEKKEIRKRSCLWSGYNQGIYQRRDML